jgi:hypothetical protein
MQARASSLVRPSTARRRSLDSESQTRSARPPGRGVRVYVDAGGCPGACLERKNAPARAGAGAIHFWLVRFEVLPVGQVDHVLQHRSAWRQLRRIQERVVEVVETRRRTVDQVAALESTGRVLRVIQTDQRSAIIQPTRSAPSLNVAQEVVDSAVGAEVLSCARRL